MAEQTQQKTNRAPDRARVLMAQAVHLQQQAQYEEAERLYRTVLAEAPDYADALHFLGLLKHQRDGSAESLELMRKSVESGPPNPGYLVNYGRVLQAHGQLEESIKQFRKALAISPSFPEALNGLGQNLEMQGMPFKALESYCKAYEIDPSNLESTMNYARALRNTGEFATAADVSRRAAQMHPGELQFVYLEVLCLLDDGKAEAALERMRTALREDPLSAQLQYSMGLVMAELGKFDAAKEHYAKALAIDPRYYAAYYNLTAIQTPTENEPQIEILEQKLRQMPPQTPEAAVSAEFGLGKMLEDRGDYDDAFKHFEIGNKIMRQRLPYSSATQSEYVDSLLQHLGEDFIARCSKVGSDTGTPVFILGMIRSGTSLVEQILAGHPEIAAGGELPFLPQALTRYTDTLSAGGGKIAALSDDNLRAIGQHYLEKIGARHPGARRVTDKLPGNFMLLGLIRALFPKARIIHCRRDALDTCVSCYLTHFDTGHHYAYDQQELGEYYVLYRRMLDYYEDIIDPEVMLNVDYEDLVSDIEGTARRTLEFCDLAWDPACLELGRTGRMVQTASMYQVRQPVHSRSVGRWRHYATHIEPLRKALGGLAAPAQTG